MDEAEQPTHTYLGLGCVDTALAQEFAIPAAVHHAVVVGLVRNVGDGLPGDSEAHCFIVALAALKVE